jgi:hypothetical protein
MHPFSIKKDLTIAQLTEEEINAVSGGRIGEVTTMALGEEGGCVTPPIFTTMAVGEEGGRKPLPIDPPITTMAIGEEGGRVLL